MIWLYRKKITETKKNINDFSQMFLFHFNLYFYYFDLILFIFINSRN